MSQRTGRNDLCPCGSGKKMKACHPNGMTPVSKNRNILLVGLGVAVVAVVAAAMMRDDSGPLQANPNRPMSPPMQAPVRSSSNAARPAGQNAARPATQQSGAGTPQPGPAPPGKVWSPEHGHWHDADKAAAAVATNQTRPASSQSIQMPSPQRPATQTAGQTPAKNIPQPTGIAPEGKVWSPEHGHYHDAPKTPPAGTAKPATETAPTTTPEQKTGPN